MLLNIVVSVVLNNNVRNYQVISTIDITGFWKRHFPNFQNKYTYKIIFIFLSLKISASVWVLSKHCATINKSLVLVGKKAEEKGEKYIPSVSSKNKLELSSLGINKSF